jgi:hypothetical protein
MSISLPPLPVLDTSNKWSRRSVLWLSDPHISYSADAVDLSITLCEKLEGTLCNLLVQYVKLCKFAPATFWGRGHTYLDIALRRRLLSPVLAVQLLLEVSMVPAVTSSEVQRTSCWYTMTD